MVLGLDLDDKCSQLSYMENETMQPTALSSVAGADKYEIPTCLAKLTGVNQWVAGEEAQRLYREGKAQLIDKLYQHALDEDPIVIEGVEYDASELLALFVKRMFGLCTLVAPWQSAQRIVISVDSLGSRPLEVWNKVLDYLNIDQTRVDLISRMEAFYNYVIHQPAELWNRDVMILDYSNEGLLVRRLEVDRKTRPAVCRIFQQQDRSIDVHNDAVFESACHTYLEGHVVSSVYLIGEPMGENEIKETLHYLCMKRRVFQGRNLYSKGACYGAWDRTNESELTKAYLFLGDDKLKSNIGLSVVNGRDNVYESLVDAGINWYEVKRHYECYLGKEREIRLLLTPLTGHNEHCAVIRLSGFPARDTRTMRIAIDLTMESEKLLKVKVTDLGFGELFPSSGQVAEEEIELHWEE